MNDVSFQQHSLIDLADKISRLVSRDDSIAESDDRLLECMNIGLVDMEIFTALRTETSQHQNMSFGYKRQVSCAFSFIILYRIFLCCSMDLLLVPHH